MQVPIRQVLSELTYIADSAMLGKDRILKIPDTKIKPIVKPIRNSQPLFFQTLFETTRVVKAKFFSKFIAPFCSSSFARASRLL